eukprot:NODE_392_length_1410_cov_282.950037_g289_i0.p3 GENE.NODE_392_length_1410_cov_282.950037_g289_i0~~NODE_392_length_1410_cov_282.950037_g289_i0.p3  ORF type:complete len:142 (-),score=37.11 NODE_392_length_1410_cov_282.950037_g289_i0:332-757(-)
MTGNGTFYENNDKHQNNNNNHNHSNTNTNNKKHTHVYKPELVTKKKPTPRGLQGAQCGARDNVLFAFFFRIYIVGPSWAQPHHALYCHCFLPALGLCFPQLLLHLLLLLLPPPLPPPPLLLQLLLLLLLPLLRLLLILTLP